MLPLIVTAVVLPLVTLSFIDHRMILETVRGTFVGPKWLQFAVGGLRFYRLAASPARMGWALDGVLWALPGCTAAVMILLPEARNLQRSNQVFQLFVAGAVAVMWPAMCARMESQRLSERWRVRAHFAVKSLSDKMIYLFYLVHALIVAIITGVLKENGFTSTTHVLLIALPLCAVAATLGSALGSCFVEKECLGVAGLCRPRIFAPHEAPGQTWKRTARLGGRLAR